VAGRVGDDAVGDVGQAKVVASSVVTQQVEGVLDRDVANPGEAPLACSMVTEPAYSRAGRSPADATASSFA
jgi:hypothetical protein